MTDATTDAVLRAHGYDPDMVGRWAEAVPQAAILERLLRALVATPPAGKVSDGTVKCFFCHSELVRYYGQVGLVKRTDPTLHAADCPWRLAQEYIARIGQGEGQ